MQGKCRKGKWRGEEGGGGGKEGMERDVQKENDYGQMIIKSCGNIISTFIGKEK